MFTHVKLTVSFPNIMILYLFDLQIVISHVPFLSPIVLLGGGEIPVHTVCKFTNSITTVY